MLCNNEDTVRVNCMAKQLKSGYLLRYKKRLFGKDWREEYVVLYSDSTLAWFRDKDRLEPDGGVVIREAPHLIAVGQWTSRIPNRPELPPGKSLATLLAFGTKNKDKVHWFLCKDEDDVNDWMTAISNTLPPPPFSQQTPAGHQHLCEVEQQQQQPPSYPTGPYTPVLPTAQPGGYRPPPPPYEASTQPYYDNRPTGPPPPFLPGTAAPPPSSLLPPQQQQHSTTVVVQQQRDSGGRNMDGFATGVLLGTALSPGWGWGCGWGWGGFGHGSWGGPGWGGGVGFYNNDADVHINNHYHINNQVVDNHHDVTGMTTTTGGYNDQQHHPSYLDGNVHNDVSGGFGADTIHDCIGDDLDYDMGYEGIGDGFDGGCDFGF